MCKCHLPQTVLPITHNCRSIMHRLEFWHTDSCVILTHTYFQSDQDSWQSFTDLAHQQNQISKVWNAKLCLPNRIPVRDTDWFKCHFRQSYFKAKSVRNSLPFYANCYHFLSMFLFSLWLKTCRFLPGLHMQRSAWQKSLMKILLLREREICINAAEKDLPLLPDLFSVVLCIWKNKHF